MNNINQLDHELLQGYLDNLGKEIVQKMLDLYQQQSTIYLEEIEKSIAEQSQALWQDKCHKMKGAAGSVGLVEVHRILVVIEKSTQDWSEKSGLLSELVELNETALACFNEWLTSYQ